MKKLILLGLLLLPLTQAETSAQRKNIDFRDLLIMENGDSIRCRLINLTREGDYSFWAVNNSGDTIRSGVNKAYVGAFHKYYYYEETKNRFTGDRFKFGLSYGYLYSFNETMITHYAPKYYWGHSYDSKDKYGHLIEVKGQLISKNSRSAYGLKANYSIYNTHVRRNYYPNRDYEFFENVKLDTWSWSLSGVYSYVFNKHASTARVYGEASVGFGQYQEKEKDSLFDYGISTIKTTTINMDLGVGCLLRFTDRSAVDIRASYYGINTLNVKGNCEFPDYGESKKSMSNHRFVMSIGYVFIK